MVQVPRESTIGDQGTKVTSYTETSETHPKGRRCRVLGSPSNVDLTEDCEDLLRSGVLSAKRRACGTGTLRGVFPFAGVWRRMRFG